MQAHVDELRGLYAAAAQDLSRFLTDGTDFQRARAGALLDQVDRIERKLGADSARVARAGVAADYTASAAHADADLRRIGLSVPGGPITARFDRVNEESIDILVRDMHRDLHRAAGQLADSARRVIRRTSQLAVNDADVSRAVARGLIAGGTARRITKDLASRFAEGESRRLLATGAITAADAQAMVDCADGIIQVGQTQLNIRNYAETVAITRLAEATTAATEDRCTQNGVDLVIVTGPATDDFCDFMVGRVFSISGRSEEYPDLADSPGGGCPYHPRCTHALAPFVLRFATAAEKERGADIHPGIMGKSPQEAQSLFRGLKAEGRQPRPREVSGMQAAQEGGA